MTNKERAYHIAKVHGEDGWQLLYHYQYCMSTAEWEDLCDEFAQSLAEIN